ncbi:hypothetical protein [Chryseobacterium fistulae]|uniref:Uncharacterized protein n=1 Tax=Chryseobacterium fistulae TaxID=2675058 RepID=A0A6N4XRC8_9FLAO|nr:hypothetical protein [Chryseobacterium fistulae]CAA7390379.1 hypothetical protein CHRY9393_02684 [Chryseobacterium fistulae]
MKRILYFILLSASLFSINSCKDLLDEDGNPLVDVNNNTGLIGPRALYREITDNGILAEYHYSGLLLTKVITDSASITDIMYSGDKVSKINFNGFLDLDGNGNLDTDSISFSQLFTYTSNGKLDMITENRSFFRRGAPVPPAILGPQLLYKKTKSVYNLKYNSSTNKLDSIIMNEGPVVSGTQSPFTNYSVTKYQYEGDNISGVVRHYGPLSGNTQGAPIIKLGYSYTSYDTQISPYTLLPFEYKISSILSTDANDERSLMLSPNSPKKVSVTDLTQPIPAPINFTTNYSYDPQTYMIRGFGINYIYKPL